MTTLTELLEREAGRVEPQASFADVEVRARRHRRRRRSVGVIAAVIVALLAVGGLTLTRRPAAVAGDAVPLSAIAALSVPDPPGDLVHTGALDRHDPDALTGPWTVVVRAHGGGSLGLHSAVVSYPVPPAPLASAVRVGDVAGFAADGQVVWPISGNYARVRGDLDADQLLAIAEATTVVDGRPVVAPVAGLDIGPSRPYRPVDIHELRIYDMDTELTFVYTGVSVDGGFEDQVFAANGRTGYSVQGHPAVVSSVDGGNGTIAWEPAPGVVAYVGYSGPQMDDDAIAALVGIAERTVPIGAGAWNALQPQVVEQHNGPVDM